MPEIQPGDYVRFRVNMQVQEVTNGVVKLRWIAPCVHGIGVEVHEFTLPGSCLEVAAKGGGTSDVWVQPYQPALDTDPYDKLGFQELLKTYLEDTSVRAIRAPIDPDEAYITSD
jgi:hypothetical protein